MSEENQNGKFAFFPGAPQKRDVKCEGETAGLDELRESLARDIDLYSVLFEQAAVGIAVASGEGRWIRLNKKLCDIFGYTESELYGRYFHEIRHSEDSEKNIDTIHQFLAGEKENIWLEMRFANRYNIDGWINLNATMIRNEAGKPPCILFLIDDITVRKEIESHLRKRNADLLDLNRALESARKSLEMKTGELERASRYKSEFLANMSHELRSPLNSLLILARYLAENREENLNDEQVKSAGIIYKSGNDLLMLINDILDLSRIEAGRMTVYVSTVNLASAMKSLESSFRHLIENKGLEFRITIEEGLPESIRTDQQKLEQILRNFISNSVKFTARGRVSLEIARPDAGVDLSLAGLTHDKCMAFSVTDTGIGIPPEKQEEIFEAFRQADGSTTRRYGGTGLGLSISKELAKLLGGEIQVKSSMGRGSIFTLFIPESLGTSESVKRDRRSARRIRKEIKDVAVVKDDLFKGKKIIIADNDMRNLYALGRILHDRGAVVYKAPDGRKTLDILKKEPDMDIVLIEPAIPDMDGYELIRKIRGHREYNDIPVFAVSSRAMKEDRQKCMEAGASEFIAKPLDIERLFSLLEERLIGAAPDNPAL